MLTCACGTGGSGRREAIYTRFDQSLKSSKLQEALVEAERGLALCGKNTSDPWYWKFYLARAEVVTRKDGPAPALALLQKEIPDGTEFTELKSRRMYDQARAYFTLSDYARSRDLLTGAARIAALARSDSLLGLIGLLQANVLSRMGDWNGAELNLRYANRLAAELKDSYLQSWGLITLAFVLIHQSRFEEAVYALDKVIPTLSEVRDASQLARALNNLGWCYFRLGEYDKALQAFQKAEAINARIGDASERQACIGNMADVYYARGDLASAKRQYQRALELASARGDRFYASTWMSNLAVISIELKDWDQAEKHNRKALEIERAIPDLVGELRSLTNSARISHGRGQNDEAERIFQQVIHSETVDPAPALDAEAGLAQLYADIDRPEKADQEYHHALALVDQGRSRLVNDEYKLSYLASLIGFYQDYVDFLMSRGRTEQALELVEASRARILNERAGLMHAAQSSDAARYRQLARSSGSVFLSYWTAPKRSYVWLVTANQIEAYTLPPESRIRNLVEKYRSLIENLQNPLDIDDPTASELSETLLGPVRDEIPAGARVSVVPDGSLNALNFETLVTPGAKPHYWIEDATISVAPSLNLLSAGDAQHPEEKRLLLIGNPEPADEHFPRLLYANQEMTDIRRHFPPSLVSAVEGRNAVPSAYTTSSLSRFSYLHFTAHATANRESPLDSAIILSARDGNYKLTARDVLKQRLDANLVTISACRSAGARTYAGEGLVGFTWTFFQAGAHNVIAGLWDVSDESTPKIMDRLYAGLAEGETIPEALRSAKLALIENNQAFRLPYYWGALQLYCRDHLDKRGKRRSGGA